MDNYHVDNELGQGSGGSKVYKGRCKRSLEFVAVKSVPKIHATKVSWTSPQAHLQGVWIAFVRQTAIATCKSCAHLSVNRLGCRSRPRCM